MIFKEILVYIDFLRLTQAITMLRFLQFYRSWVLSACGFDDIDNLSKSIFITQVCMLGETNHLEDHWNEVSHLQCVKLHEVYTKRFF